LIKTKDGTSFVKGFRGEDFSDNSFSGLRKDDTQKIIERAVNKGLKTIKY